ncbi:DUF5118 domain-containing protein [Bacteroides sp. CR5/BHMF/2]|nr:DUF5118 domain-containing protein [Bacteroides sp. CR5/BHMF/2]
MTIHKVEDKIYVEFPVAMLGRELLFTSSIENTSDGEKVHRDSWEEQMYVCVLR